MFTGPALGGASGGYTSGRKEIIAWLRQRSRPYLFSNSIPPFIAAASLRVLDMLEAASQGIAGAMCTLHSKDSLSVFRRILLYARQGHGDLAAADVLETASLALDLVVHLDRRPGEPEDASYRADTMFVTTWRPGAGVTVDEKTG